MQARTLNDIAQACGGTLVHGSPELRVLNLCTDSRQLQAGDLFLALKGERFDGHTFLPSVAASGASAVIAEPEHAAKLPTLFPLITVADTRQALGRLAAAYRLEFSLPVVAVAGSNGKTSTKELLAALLRRKFPTLASEASFNNDIGVPLTLLKLQPDHRAAVLEVGTNHPGELAPLLRMIQPQYGILTSLGREHLEFFGDLEGVAREEGFLAEALPPHGRLFVNGDTPLVEQVIARCRAPVVRVGFNETNDWHAEVVHLDLHGSRFSVRSPLARLTGEYQVNLLGRHQVLNALLAMAVAAELGLSREEIQAGLASSAPAKMRMQLRRLKDFQVLDDGYNANADSMRAALETLRDLPCAGQRIAVLGEMGELGAHSEAAHVETGRHAARTAVDQLFAVGPYAGALASAARAAGLRQAEHFEKWDELVSRVKRAVQTGDLVLVKGSRSARMERIVEALQER